VAGGRLRSLRLWVWLTQLDDPSGHDRVGRARARQRSSRPLLDSRPAALTLSGAELADPDRGHAVLAGDRPVRLPPRTASTIPLFRDMAQG
jgi:hypothetical protein